MRIVFIINVDSRKRSAKSIAEAIETVSGWIVERREWGIALNEIDGETC